MTRMLESAITDIAQAPAHVLPRGAHPRRLGMTLPGPADSLLPRMNSLLGQKNFPAPMGQGIGRKRLNLFAEWLQTSSRQAEILQIPCSFPCCQGIRRNTRAVPLAFPQRKG